MLKEETRMSLMNDMREKLAKEKKHKLETEILPRIREQIEELRRRLEEIGKEKKLKYVDQKIETISAKL